MTRVIRHESYKPSEELLTLEQAKTYLSWRNLDIENKVEHTEDGDVLVARMSHDSVLEFEHRWKILKSNEMEYIDVSALEFSRACQELMKECRRIKIAHDISMPGEEAYAYHGNGPDKTVWVSIYTVTRHWGGPEEGGWWWDRVVLERTIPTAGERDVLQSVCNRLRKWAIENELKYGNIGHSTGGQDCYIAFEEEPGSREELEKPSYE